MNDEDRKWLAGLFRLWLGLAQMAGATIAALLLWASGLSSATIFAVLLTTALTVLSALVREGTPRHEVESIDRRRALREGAGELGASTLLVLVFFFSGSLQVQFGTAPLEAAMISSTALGLGFGLVIWTFGRLSGAQGNPLVSLAAAVWGDQSWLSTALRIAGQLAGAAIALAATAVLVPPALVHTASSPEVHPAAEIVAAFAFMLVAIGVAHYRDARVPVALGAFATASVWMTGQATVGNPLLSIAAAFTSSHGAALAAAILRTSGASGMGAILGTIMARFLFARTRDSMNLLLFVPRTSSQA